MKLKLVRSIIFSLLSVWLLTSCGAQVPNSSTAIKPNSQSSDSSISANPDRFLFRRNTYFGYIDRTGAIVIPAKFDRVGGSFVEGLANFSEDLEPVSIGEKWGYIDRMGQIVIPLEFDQTLSFHEGLGNVSIADQSGSQKWGYVDRTGKIVIPIRFGSGRFENGLARVTDGNADVTIDKTGKVVATSAVPVEAPQGESNGLISFEENKKYGIKDRTGKIVIPAQFDWIGSSYPERGNSASYFHDGLASICLKHKCGYIDKTGKIVVPLQFDFVASRFSDGLARVEIGKKLGYVDKTGKLVIPARYRQPNILTTRAKVPEDLIEKCDSFGCFTATPNFDRGLAVVCKGAGDENCNRIGYIDTTGKLVFEF